LGKRYLAAAALKDILTEKGSIQNQELVLLILIMQDPPKKVIDDEQESVLRERLPTQCEVNWDTHTAQDYFKLLKLY
jgi:hypothetical protein